MYYNSMNLGREYTTDIFLSILFLLSVENSSLYSVKNDIKGLLSFLNKEIEASQSVKTNFSWKTWIV